MTFISTVTLHHNPYLLNLSFSIGKMTSTTVILGSGIIGLSTAHYLSKTLPATQIHLVEPSPTLFASASGFAGGFLAKDWFSPAVADLGALSFAEHRRLAEEHGGREKWGYERSKATSFVRGEGKGVGAGDGNGTEWLRHGSSRAEAATTVAGESEYFDAEERDLPRWLRVGESDTVEVISEEGTTAQVYVSLFPITIVLLF
jgi:glycine/D-amino acid oxidase-like deaminating enzyme